MTSNVRGVDHVGIAVRDLDEASSFLEAALGAEVIYDLLRPHREHGTVVVADDGGDDQPLDLGDVRVLDAEEGLVFRAHRMMRLGDGPNLELLQIEAPAQRVSPYGDFGVNHLSVFVQDIAAAAARVRAAGGELFDRFPMFGLERGERAEAQYFLGPSGLRIELISYGELAYERTTPLRRSHAGVRGA